eukprot:SAG22_NODE_12401_length_444_cov_0.733333_1_plen_117_part_10
MTLARQRSDARDTMSHPSKTKCKCCGFTSRKLGNEFHNKRICFMCDARPADGLETKEIPKNQTCYRARVRYQDGTIPYELHLCDEHYAECEQTKQAWWTPPTAASAVNDPKSMIIPL